MSTHSSLIAGAVKPLSAADLARDFGPDAVVCKRCVAKLYETFRAGHPALDNWKTCVGRIWGADWQRSTKALQTLAHKLALDPREFMPDAFLFALQTYYARLLEILVRRFVPLAKQDYSLEPFSGRVWTDDTQLAAERERLSALMAEYQPLPIDQGPEAAQRDSPIFVDHASMVPAKIGTVPPGTSGDFLKALYQALFPRRLRHILGEFYTPDWLAGHVLDQVGFDGGGSQRLLDPACGSGTFLLCAIKRIRTAWATSPLNNGSDSDKNKLCRRILSQVVGIDLNPLAVMSARANYLLAIHDLLPLTEPWEIPVYLGDSILDLPPLETLRREQFDVVAGNPPWIAWDNLPLDYREATKPLWEHYGLFSLSGKDGRHGGGKKDLSMLMLYVVADRYLKNGGHLGFVITQTLFQTKGAGDGFRSFRLGQKGPWLNVRRVDDLVALRPFNDAANWTSTVVLKKGEPTQYPVPYFKWEMPTLPDQSEKRVLTPFFARPIDRLRPRSPWFLEPEGFRGLIEKIIGPSDYEAHLGANTGGANGVYWVELLGKDAQGMRVRNVAEKSKSGIETVEKIIEPDLLYPLLRWRDIAPYAAQPRYYLILAQDCDNRTGIDEALMREKYPRTLAYLEHFKGFLTNRAAYRRYQQGRPFYSMYNVGPYTTAPIKVVWRRMDRRLSAAVAECRDEPLLGPRPLIPQETCAMIACQSLPEAYYLCAVLNSSLVNYLVQSHSVQGGKSFGTPSILMYLNLRRFNPENSQHNELAACGLTAHQTINPEIQCHIDRLVAELYDVDTETSKLFFTHANM